LAILERIVGGYPIGSEENDAIKLAAEVMLFLFTTETRQAFVKVMSEVDRPLTEHQRIHLRAIGIDPDTFEQLEDGKRE
jgi:ribulose bisphosphate carboxylase small subunit